MLSAPISYRVEEPSDSGGVVKLVATETLGDALKRDSSIGVERGAHRNFSVANSPLVDLIDHSVNQSLEIGERLNQGAREEEGAQELGKVAISLESVSSRGRGVE